MNETHKRSLLKAISWRITGTLATFSIIWIVSGEAVMAGAVASIEVVAKFALFYVHERIWNRIPLGKQKVVDSSA